ncbi:MAG: M28 family peptidase, partial [Bacteroidota bacterium]
MCAHSDIFGQNNPPSVTNVVATPDLQNDRVDFSYDLADTESDPCEVYLRVSADSGLTWLVTMATVSGDTGFPITPGTGKSITWQYDPQTLANTYGSGPYSFVARIIADDRVTIDIQDIVDQVDSAALVGNLQYIEGIRHRTSGAVHLQATKDTLDQHINAHNLQNWSHTFTWGNYTAHNYVGRLSGTTDEADTWMTCGHYDTDFDAPGADDNGTAVAGVMEAARLLSGYHFRNSIRFAYFDLEEEFLNGSSFYVLNEVQDWEDFRGLLNMEMIGYYDEAVNSQSVPFGFNLLFPAAYNTLEADSFRGNFLTNVANTNSDPLKTAFDQCAAAYVPDLKVISLATPGNGLTTPDLRRSDHAPFWDGGYQALMLTDGANLRNPFYHTPADTIGILDLQFFYQSVKAVVATLAKQAQPVHVGIGVSNDFLLNLPVGIEQPIHLHDLRVFPTPGRHTVHVTFDLPHVA